MIPSSIDSLKLPPKLLILARFLAITLLILVLQIPLLMVNSVRSERTGLRTQAFQEVGERWGDKQKFIGPILVVPYCYRMSGDVTLRRANAYFLPEEMELQGNLSPEIRRRGIFSIPVYTAEVTVKGRFAKPDWSQFEVQPLSILWNEARVQVPFDDLVGLREAPDWEFCGKKQTWQSTTLWSAWPKGVHSVVSLAAGQEGDLSFSLSFRLAGNGSLSVAPLGKTSRITLRSSWADPSFIGYQLPESRSISAQGFEAQWRSNHLGREFPQFWTDRNGVSAIGRNEILASLVGVSLIPPMDAYRTTERALKHSMLVITLVFAAFFIFEISSRRTLASFQYVLVGAALCLFYLGLLALSEFFRYELAYLMSALASIVLVGAYCTAVLRSRSRGLLAALGLALVYAYLYFVLQMQDYALLAGTLALFAILGAVMWVTRRLGVDDSDTKLPDRAEL